MSSGKARLVFFGNERLATGLTSNAPTLQRLITAGYDIAAVVANNNQSELSRNKRKLEIAAVAEEHKIPLILPNKPIEIMDKLKSYNAQAGILVAYGKIVPQEIIDVFPCGIVNIHPSLLPKHRGPTPIESTILEGAKTAGVSIMRLEKEMDAGPIYTQQSIPLSGQETKHELAEKLLAIGGRLLVRRLPAILSGKLKPKKQNSAYATYDKLISSSDGHIDWSLPAVKIERQVRAYLDWPKSRTTIGNLRVVITASKVVNKQIRGCGKYWVENKQLFVSCGKDSLEILKLKPSGKNEMTAEAFLAGYGKKID